ncbi:MAG TPA: transcription elongation factor GreA [Candidatus Limnocylindrales bacterium]|nr:transcription elongation factor GreA [Candidatus Limnocylindrales bacterium]
MAGHSADDGAAALFRSVGLLADGPAQLGRPIRAAGPGVYVVELAAPLATAPIELTRVGKWLERVPGLRLDGERPTSRALAARLAAFWLPSRTVLFVGSTSGAIGGRLAALEGHVLGDPRPHAAAQWLRTLDVTGLRAWWALTDAPEEYEDALLEAFAATVPPADRANLPDTSVILPFANLRTTTGTRKAYGITGAVLPLEKPPAPPPTRVTALAPGDADGARIEDRGSGTTRRAPRAPNADGARRVAYGAGTGGSRPSRAAGRATGPAAGRPAHAADPPDTLELTADGLARLRAELDELIRVRRPEVVARIRTAKELGDLRENADYTAAREEQSFLEGRIQAIEARLRTAVVAGSAAGSARAVLGSQVQIERDDGIDTEAAVITIVGTSESDPSAGRISAASPVGRALLGRSAGDEVTVRTPNGEVRYRILGLD